jgi:hypothetical protein
MVNLDLDTLARSELGVFLAFAFDERLPTLQANQIGEVVDALRGPLRVIEPGLTSALRGMPTGQVRDELLAALATVRVMAHDVTAGRGTRPMRMSVDLSVGETEGDRDGLPAWTLRLRLADALVWIAARWFSMVPRALVRPCAFAGCARVYVGGRNRRFCPGHQHEARRQAQRRAIQAFRARAAAKRTAPTPRRKNKR